MLSLSWKMYELLWFVGKSRIVSFAGLPLILKWQRWEISKSDTNQLLGFYGKWEMEV